MPPKVSKRPRAGRVADSDSHPSGSAVQREAEQEALAAFSKQLGIELRCKSFALSEGASIQIDGVCEGSAGVPSVLVEVFAHQGPLKAGQRHKLMSDAVKLLLAARRFDSEASLVLLVTDEQAARDLRTGWRAEGLRAFAIEVRVAQLPEQLRARLREAQARQRMVNAVAE